MSRFSRDRRIFSISDSAVPTLPIAALKSEQLPDESATPRASFFRQGDQIEI
jgi:hypothetical protein